MLITFQESELICKMFRQYVMDRDLDIRDDDECRCAIKVYVNHIQNVLADYYDVEPKEGGNG